jgi:hypothetical protein
MLHEAQAEAIRCKTWSHAANGPPLPGSVVACGRWRYRRRGAAARSHELSPDAAVIDPIHPCNIIRSCAEPAHGRTRKAPFGTLGEPSSRWSVAYRPAVFLASIPDPAARLDCSMSPYRSA